MRCMFFPVCFPEGIFGRLSLWDPHLASLCLSWGKLSNHGLKAFTSHAGRRGLIQLYMLITLKPDSSGQAHALQRSCKTCQWDALGSILKMSTLVFQNYMKTIRIQQDSLNNICNNYGGQAIKILITINLIN